METRAPEDGVPYIAVRRDTVVGGVPALVIRLRQQLQLRSEGPVPGQPVRAQVTPTGCDDGYFVFAPAAQPWP